MTNETGPRPIELTGGGINPTLKSEGNIMPDTPGGAEATPRPLTPEQIQAGVGQWVNFWERQGQGANIDPHALSSARLAVESGNLPPSEAEGERDSRSRSSESDRRIISVLSKPDVLAELTSPTPDFSKDTPGLTVLRRFIKELDPADRDEKIAHFADYISNPDWENLRREMGLEISTESKKLLFEWTLENIIGLPEKGSHEADYRNGISDIYTQNNLSKLKAFSSNNFDQEFATYIGDLIEFRSTAHELRRSLTQGDAYKEFIQKQLKAHGLDFILNDIAGISEVVSLWETFTSLKAAQRRTWLDEGDYKDIQERIKTVAHALQSKGQLTKNGRPLADWEVDRALAVGATFFRGTQRFAMYSSVGELPPGAAQRIGSHKDEYIVRTMAQFKVTAVRYFNEGGPGEFLKHIRERLRGGGGVLSNENSLFGIKDEAWLYNGLGALDIESHGWRAHLMFFGDTKVNIDRGGETLLQYFTRKAIEHGSHFDEALGWEHGPGESKAFAKSVEDAILGQRLYLSTLIKHGFWGAMDDKNTKENKKQHKEGSKEKLQRMLWQKVAMFDPMGIASLSPDVLNGLSPQERKTWTDLYHKMGIASIVRLNLETAGDDPDPNVPEKPGVPKSSGYWKKDGKRVERTGAELKAEKEAFLAAVDGRNDSYKYQIIDRYFGENYGNELKPEEIEVIKKVINAGVDGKKGAEYLESVKLPFAFLVNDTPKHVAWDKTGEGEAGLGDENLFRILLSDQGNLIAGYNEMNGMVENPTHGAIEHLSKAVESIGQVIGRHDAQKRIEPFILAYLDMAAERPTAWAFGGLVDFYNRLPVKNKRTPWIGNSEFEKYWRSSGLSFDEEDRAAFLESLARLEAISTDVSKGVTTSQLARLKKETESWGLWTNWKFIKIFILIFGPVVGLQLVKSLVPKELWDSVGIK